jgi:hypothetical protein
MMQCWPSKEKPRGDEVAWGGLDRPRLRCAGDRLPPEVGDVSGGEVQYIFWRRIGERRPDDMPLVGRRDTFPCMHSGESGKCGQPALWCAISLDGYVVGPFG